MQIIKEIVVCVNLASSTLVTTYEKPLEARGVRSMVSAVVLGPKFFSNNLEIESKLNLPVAVTSLQPVRRVALAS